MRDWMKKSLYFLTAIIAIYFLAYFFIIFLDIRSQNIEIEDYNSATWNNPLENGKIRDNPELYSKDIQDEVDQLFMTYIENNENISKGLYRFSDLLLNREDNSKPRMEIYIRDKDENILDDPIITIEPNATISLRGKTPYSDVQKSFRVDIYQKEGLWHQQKILNFNKHYDDELRIRNKLSFDYFSIIPDIVSLRTRFVNLYARDGLKFVSDDNEFIDLGLYTQVEQPNNLFLINHNLNPNGNLYKAENFNFSRYADQIRLKKDEAYRQEEFEKILTIRASDDHEKLIEMLDAVNDYDRNIDDVVKKYFDRDNFLNWVAANIIMDNYEASTTNFFIYSPVNSDKWYFIPWDCDGAWSLEDSNKAKWKKGLQMYWDNILFKRFFENRENVESLTDRVDTLSTIINQEQTTKFLDRYYKIVMNQVTKLPDLEYLPVDIEEYAARYKLLASLPEKNVKIYKALLENPMPFILYEEGFNGGGVTFTWEKPFDIQDEDLKYDFYLSYTKDFENIIRSTKNISKENLTLYGLSKGTYYWKVVARDGSNNSQIPLNIYKDERGDLYYGVKKFAVK